VADCFQDIVIAERDVRLRPQTAKETQPCRPPRRPRQVYAEYDERLAGYNQSMIRKLQSGLYRLYSRKKDPKTGKRRNLGTFRTLAAAEKHERAVQFFKRHG